MATPPNAPPTTGVKSGFAKCFIFFMATVILLQGCLYMGLAIWGFTMKQCRTDNTYDLASQPFSFAMDLIYFRSEECGYPTVTLGDEGIETLNSEVQIDWSVSHEITNRMYIFLICYAVVSGLWILTSLMVITSICGKISNMVSAVCFWPWFFVVIAGSILDLVMFGFSVSDLTETTSAQETFDFVGVTNAGDLILFLQNFDPYFMTPAIIMICISSRVVLVWMLNIFGTGFCLSMSKVLANANAIEKSGKHTKPTNTQPAAANTLPSAETQVPQQNPTEPEDLLIRPRPLPIQIAQAPPQQVNRRSTPQPVNAQTPNPVVATPYMAQQEASATSPPVSSTNVRPTPLEIIDITYRNTETHPDRLNYPSQQQTPQQQQPTMQTPQTLYSPQASSSVISPLNNRYADKGFPYQPQQPQQQQRVSAELRSQLPWSYTNAPPPTPRKPQVQMYPQIPQIPEPDYMDEDEQPRHQPHQQQQQQQQHQGYSRW